MVVLAVRGGHLREREKGLGLEVAKMRFLQKRGLIYAKFWCSKGTFATVSGALKVAMCDFSLQ